MKVLIICFGGPAELLFTTPVLRCLKQQLKGTEIHYLLLSQYKSVLDSNHNIDHFHLIQDGRTGLSQLDAENYDHVIDLQCDDASTKIAKALNRPVLRYKKTGFFQFVSSLGDASSHMARRYLAAVKPLGVRNDGAGLDYTVPWNGELTEKDIPASHHFGFVAITVGANHSGSAIPSAKIQELCKAIKHPVALLGDKNEYSKSEVIASFDPIKVYNACGKFSFPETADLIRKSKLVVAQDHDLMQLAAALKKPVIAVWGNTSATRSRSPYYGSKADLFDDVKLGNSKNIKIDEILLLVNKRLSATPNKVQAKK